MAQEIFLFFFFLGKKEKKKNKRRFIVPLPQICKYNDSNFWKVYKPKSNSWNDILYKPKSILFFSSVYKWWDFAAIIDFKWNKFGRYYCFWIWLRIRLKF